jgi:membrane protein YdbS with pleckstrin-like domain
MGRPLVAFEDHEEVLLDTGPHWLVLAPRLMPAALVVALCAAGFLLWRSAPGWFGWLLLGGVLCSLAHGLAKTASWRARRLLVTNRRVVYHFGILRRTGQEIPIARVQDVTFRQGLLERLLGIGEVEVASAGSRSRQVIGGLRHPANVQRIVNRAIEAAGRSPVPERLVDLVGGLERLEELRRQGIVTDAEFARTKATLLASLRGRTTPGPSESTC